MKKIKDLIKKWVVGGKSLKNNVIGHNSDPQIWLARSTLLQSLAPTLIKLTYLGSSNDPEDILWNNKLLVSKMHVY